MLGPGDSAIGFRALRAISSGVVSEGLVEVVPSNRQRNVAAQSDSYVKWHLLLGDRSPALVVSERPFIVAAYSEEQDGIVMLEFDARMVEPEFRAVGTKLITLNLDYSSKYGSLAADLRRGPNSSGRWTNFLPLIGEFLSRDRDRLAQLRASIPVAWWQRVASMVNAYDYRCGVRDGRLGFAAQPAVGNHRWSFFERGR